MRVVNMFVLGEECRPVSGGSEPARFKERFQSRCNSEDTQSMHESESAAAVADCALV